MSDTEQQNKEGSSDTNSTDNGTKLCIMCKVLKPKPSFSNRGWKRRDGPCCFDCTQQKNKNSTNDDNSFRNQKGTHIRFTSDDEDDQEDQNKTNGNDLVTSKDVAVAAADDDEYKVQQSKPPSAPQELKGKGNETMNKSNKQDENDDSEEENEMKLDTNDNLTDENHRLVFSDGESIQDGGSGASSASTSSPAPRRGKNKRSKKPNNIYDSDDESTSDKEGVSLGALKRQILGRDLVAENEDVDNYDQEYNAVLQVIKRHQQETEDENDNHLLIQKSSNKGASTTILPSTVSSLRRDLTCSICHELFFQPVTVPCGHSFCKECIQWWFGTMTNNTTTTSPPSSVKPACPTCRRPLCTPDDMDSNTMQPSFGVATALRCCVMALFGKELMQRIQTKQTSVKGEPHRLDQTNRNSTTEYEEVVPDDADDDDPSRHFSYRTSIRIHFSDDYKATPGLGQNKRHKVLFIKVRRRSIRIDAQDSRMQLALALKGDPILLVSNNDPMDDSATQPCLQLRFCLVTMEEDEVADFAASMNDDNEVAGFPVVIRTTEDEHLICSTEDRFRLGSRIEVYSCSTNQASTMRRSTTSTSTQERTPVAWLPFLSSSTSASSPEQVQVINADDEPGVVTYRIYDKEEPSNQDASSQSTAVRESQVFVFRHDETGADLELEIPQLLVEEGDDYYEDEMDTERNSSRKNQSPKKKRSFVMEDDEDEEEEEESDHENDSVNKFIVNDSDVEDEDAGCIICGEHGELIICDGGDDVPGVGCEGGFHISCIQRDEIPPGNWICQNCVSENSENPRIKMELKDRNISAINIDGLAFPPSVMPSSDEEDANEISRNSKRKKRKIRKIGSEEKNSSDDGSEDMNLDNDFEEKDDDEDVKRKKAKENKKRKVVAAFSDDDDDSVNDNSDSGSGTKEHHVTDNDNDVRDTNQAKKHETDKQSKSKSNSLHESEDDLEVPEQSKIATTKKKRIVDSDDDDDDGT